MKIGIFDSGVGGKSFIAPIQAKFPQAEIIYREDRENLPYGDKSPQKLLELTVPIFKELESVGCDAVLVACNTLTTNCISELRRVVDMPLVGVEPMIKSASEITTTKSVVVCATPATINSDRYSFLKDTYAQGLDIYEPDCSKWSSMIEQSRSSDLELSVLVNEAVARKADVLVLGCTHYHWLAAELQLLCGGDNIKVIQPIQPVLDQLARVLEVD